MSSVKFVSYITSIILLGIGLLFLLIQIEIGVALIIIGLIQIIFIGLKNVWYAIKEGIYASGNSAEK
jgi:hypothetical protein